MTYRVKALGTATNSRAELNDLYGDAVHETIYNENTFFNKVRRVKNSSDRAGFRVRTARNPTADSYAELETIVTGNSTRQRVYFDIQQVKVGVEVSGLEIESAKGTGGIGDIWAKEIRDAASDLAQELDVQILGTADPASSDDISGLRYLLDDGTNYTTFGSVSDRTATGYEWAKATIEETAEDLSLTRMRTMWKTCKDAGAKLDNLMYLTNDTQLAKFLDLIQNMQRTTPTSSRVGFVGLPEYDGIPIVTDHNVTAGYMYCIDMSTMEYRVLKDLTIEPLPEPKDAKAAFIKTYSQCICTHPAKSYKKSGLTT